MVPCGAASDAGPWLPAARALFPQQYGLALVTAILLLGGLAVVLWSCSADANGRSPDGARGYTSLRLLTDQSIWNWS